MVTKSVLCTDSEIKSDFARKKRKFFLPRVFIAPWMVLGILCRQLGSKKLELWPTQKVDKFDEMCIILHTIPERDGWTDGPTEKNAISVTQRHIDALSVIWRLKKVSYLKQIARQYSWSILNRIFFSRVIWISWKPAPWDVANSLETRSCPTWA